jgi:hypothetical protein
MNIFLLILLILVFILILWAFFSGGNSVPKTPEDDLALRRRAADRDESITPENIPSDRRGNRSTDRKERESDEDTRDIEVGDDFSLPNQPAAIIPLGSPYEVYRKTLSNAEAYIKKGEFATARSLYEGIHDRIGDSDIREKIEENLDYLNNYHQVAAKRMEEKRKQSKTGANEIRLTLEGTENLAGRLQEALNQPSGRLSQQEQLLDKYRDELASLRNDIRMIEKDRLTELRSNEDKYQNDSDEIMRLREELVKLKEQQIESAAMKQETASNMPYSAASPSVVSEPISEIMPELISDDKDSKEVQNLMNELGIREQENDLLRERMSLMKKEMEMISREKESFSDVEEKIRSELSNRSGYNPKVEAIDELKNEISAIKNSLSDIKNTNAEHTKSTESNHKDDVINELKEEISSLNDSLSAIKNTNAELPRSTEGNPKDTTISELKNEISALKDSLSSFGNAGAELGDLSKALKDGMESLSPMLKDSIDKKVEEKTKDKQNNDKKDDFQLLEEIAHGQNFDEPTDEDVMAKILNDAVKEHAKKNAREKNEKENESPDKNKPSKNNRNKKDTRDEFELMSDFVKGDDENGPTDDEVMEKILRGALKNKEIPDGEHAPNTGGQSNEPSVRKKKELPILRVSYNFSRLPDEFTLSIDKNHLEYSFYKFKPLLEKAADYVKRRKVKDAINYYRVVMDQDIPQEFKDMLFQNIKDLNEYLTKYYTSG